MSGVDLVLHGGVVGDGGAGRAAGQGGGDPGRVRRGAGHRRARPARRAPRARSTSRAARCWRPSATATSTRCGVASSWPGRRSGRRPRWPRSPTPSVGGRPSTRTSSGCRAAPTTPASRPAAGSTRPGWTPPCRTGRWCCSRPTTTASGRTARPCAGPASTSTLRTRRPARSRAAPTAPRWGRWSSGPRWTWCCGTRRGRPRPRSRTGWPRPAALFAAAGITWVQEAALLPADVEAYLATAAAGRLPVRANMALRADPGRWTGQRAEFVAARRGGRRLAGRRPGVGADREDVRRRRGRGGHRGDARPVRRPARLVGALLRPARVDAGRADGGRAGLRRRRLPAARARDRRRRGPGHPGRVRGGGPGQRAAGPPPGASRTPRWSTPPTSRGSPRWA